MRTVLFQGDSITDAGRSRQDDNDLGYGYPAIAAAWYFALYPGKRRTLHQPRHQWQPRKGPARALAGGLPGSGPDEGLHPDRRQRTWRRYDSHDPTSTETYEHIIARSSRPYVTG